MKVCFETFGCRLSRAEALEQEAEFAARGWERTEGHADADLIVVRGCSVTQRAQRDCERLVEHIRRKYPMKRSKKRLKMQDMSLLVEKLVVLFLRRH
jgi:threonylcarbamoyladenosine tRNA methylthiotransferase MtaB